jgi:hypothetical protein
MRIKRAILIPAILAFGAAGGSALAASAVAAAPAASVVAMAPSTWYQG